MNHCVAYTGITCTINGQAVTARSNGGAMSELSTNEITAKTNLWRRTANQSSVVSWYKMRPIVFIILINYWKPFSYCINAATQIVLLP